jgi:hypothetical protein
VPIETQNPRKAQAFEDLASHGAPDITTYLLVTYDMLSYFTLTTINQKSKPTKLKSLSQIL